MKKVVDITDKLEFNGNPVIKIRDVELEVNTDAKTMLQIMGIFDTESEIKAALKAADLLFGSKGIKKLESLNLSIKDFMAVIQTSMSAAMGNEDGTEPGEGKARTMI